MPATSPTLRLRLALAASAAGAAAGALLTLSSYLGDLAADPSREARAAELLAWLRIGLPAGLAVGTLPAFFAGAALWALGARAAGLRRAPAWAAAGAGVGAALWTVLAAAVRIRFDDLGLDEIGDALFAASLVGGAGGALAFRAVMRLTAGPSRRSAGTPR